MKSSKNIFAILNVAVVLATMSRNELRKVASAYNVPRGQNKSDTVANLQTAIENDTLRIRAEVSLKAKPVNGQMYGSRLWTRKYRSYFTHSGQYDRTLLPVTVPAPSLG